MTRKKDRSTPRSDRFWRRLALAAAISFGLHLFVAVWARPDFHNVADRAVPFEVAEITPGPPAPVPSEDKEPPKIEEQGPPAPPPENEKARKTPKPDETQGALVEEKDTDPDTGADTEARVDTGGSTGSTDTTSGTDTDTAGGGSGICLHDLFPFAPSEPNWMLWVSTASLRGTVFEKDVAGALGSYGITRKLERVTGLDPATDVASILVTAEDILNWKTYRVAASHDVPEQKLKNAIAASYSGTSFSWRPTPKGWQAISPDGFRYHLVASGRALVVEALKQKPRRQKPQRAEEKDSDTAPHAPEQAASGTDADLGHTQTPRAEADTHPQDHNSGTVAPGDKGSDFHSSKDSAPSEAPTVSPGAHPGWPRQIRCLMETTTAPPANSSTGDDDKNTPQSQAPKTPSPGDSLATAKGSLRPDDGGHWPVAYLYTSDPRAIGLPQIQAKLLGFHHVSIRGFFSEDKVRLWGRVYLSAPQERIEKLASGWARLAQASRNDPFVKMVGLSGVIDHITLNIQPGSISFTVELTAAQTRAGLLFLRMQGEALSRRLSSP